MTIDQLPSTESVIACDWNAIAPEDRDQHMAIGTAVYAAVQEVRDLPDGYALRLPITSEMLVKAAEYISNDRLCCSFVRYTLDIEPHGEAIWMRLTGGEAVKAYIKTELPPLLNEDVARAAGLR